jgi:hypothetical protein
MAVIIIIIIIIIYLSCSWATCWPVPVSRVQKLFQRSAMIPSTNRTAVLNLHEPCVLYIGQAHRYPPNTPFYVFFQKISVLNFLNMLHTLRIFLFKMPFIS